MATNSFLLNPFTGDPAQVEVTLTDVGSDIVQVKLNVVSGYLADTVGFFANFNGVTVNNAFNIAPVSSSPATITGVATSTAFGKLYLDNSGSTTDQVRDVDSNVNLNGDGDQRTYQLGVQIGKGGAPPTDDYQSVTFNLSAPGLDVGDFSKIGMRLQSVLLANGTRSGSSKLEGLTTDTPKPSIAINKVTNGADGLQILADSPVTWTYTVTNPGNVPLTDLNVTDNQGVLPKYISGDTNGNGNLDPLTETWLYKATGTAITGLYQNIGTVTSNYNGTPVNAEDPSNYFGAAPKIDVEKYVSVDSGGTWEDADTATGPSLLTGNNPQFKFVVKNEGNVDLSNITLSDPYFDLNGTDEGTSINIASLATGASSETILTAPWKKGQHTNKATVSTTYTDGVGNTADLKDTDYANYFGAEPAIDVKKSVSVDGGSNWIDADSDPGPTLLESGADPQFKFAVHNTGNVALSNVTLRDDNFNLDVLYGDAFPDNSQYDIGNLGINMLLEVVLTGAVWSAGQHTNTATTNGSYTDDAGNISSPSDTDKANYFGADPKIEIVKETTATTAYGSQTGDGIQNVLVGTPVTWTYTVKNTGNVPFELSKITVTDNKGVTPSLVTDNNFIVGDINKDNKLDPNETWKYTASGIAIAGNYTNTGTVTVTGGFTDSVPQTTPVGDTDDSGYSSEKGLGKTPGFWKQSQHFQYWPGPYTRSDSFSKTFLGADQDGDKFTYAGVTWFNDSLLGALSAEDLKGGTGSGAVKTYGNVSALGRSATAALLNAKSDELIAGGTMTDVKGSDINYIIDPTRLSPNDKTFLSTKVDGIFGANGVRTGAADGIISSQEVLNAVKDVFTTGGGLNGALDVNTLATAFDKMNNMGGG